MKIKCENCLPKEGIEIPEFNLLDKQTIWTWKQESPILAVKQLMEVYRINHRDAKYIIVHVNKTYGKCNGCNYNKLDGEYIHCCKCKSLNFNWAIEHSG